MKEILSNSDLVNKLTDDFHSQSDRLVASVSEHVNSFRKNALADLTRLGIPTKKDERYKYSDISKLFQSADFNQFIGGSEVVPEMEDLFRCDVPELDTHSVLLINGRYLAEESLQKLPCGIIVGSFSQASKEYPELFEKHYGQYAKSLNCGLIALNTTFASDGLFIYAPKGVCAEKPIQIINLLLSETALMIQPRNLFIFEENSEAKVIVCDHTLSAQNFLTNSVTELYAGKNARVEYYKMQNEHNNSNQIATTEIFQKEGSQVLSNSITLHGGFIRNNVRVTLSEPNCESELYGIYLADQVQHIDNCTFADHASPNCKSRELYKGIIDDKAVVAFNGRILVRPDAQNTLAYQANNNILLSTDAKVYAKPQLEIYADDVKCSHGATIGQLDTNALFYLKSRGIGHKEAMTLLMYAFAHEVVGTIKIEPLKEKIASLVDKRLRGEFSRCNHCIIRCC